MACDEIGASGDVTRGVTINFAAKTAVDLGFGEAGAPPIAGRVVGAAGFRGLGIGFGTVKNAKRHRPLLGVAAAPKKCGVLLKAVRRASRPLLCGDSAAAGEQ